MNFLAHIYLSGNDADIAFGNFIGDFVKGNYKEKYSGKIATGISLHREIDQFTDKHRFFKQSKSRLRPIYGHYPPVIIDIFYDHLLARNWNEYHDESLYTFTQRFYEICNEKYSLLPSKGKELVKYMIRQNWLYNYRKIEGIEKTFNGMASRTSFVSNMESAPVDLVDHYDGFKADFDNFIPEISKLAKDYIDQS